MRYAEAHIRLTPWHLISHTTILTCFIPFCLALSIRILFRRPPIPSSLLAVPPVLLLLLFIYYSLHCVYLFFFLSFRIGFVSRRAAQHPSSHTTATPQQIQRLISNIISTVQVNNDINIGERKTTHIRIYKHTSNNNKKNTNK
uniref:Uncharacterized protein n=1 Tax=Trypanosoma congolense (strain IL3000) TaxID=1068625 RepID=G0UZK6_TRYCI|nr:hypothetical protein, unlikely [Trypanosoma congolense IL3000]